MLKIESINNPKILDVLKLQNKKERQIQKRFLVEGYHLVEEAFKHQVLESIITTNELDFKKFKVDGFLVNEKIINKLSTTVNSQGIVGIVKIEEKEINYDLYKKIIVLDNINDPGNLGTIIRTSAALGIDLIITSLDTVDLYNEKVIRATQGSIFKIPVIKRDLEKELKKLREYEFEIFATSLNTNTYIQDVKVSNKYVVIFGNEANGVRDNIFNLANRLFKIKMENDVESLNVAIAAAITIYHFNK